MTSTITPAHRKIAAVVAAEDDRGDERATEAVIAEIKRFAAFENYKIDTEIEVKIQEDTTLPGLDFTGRVARADAFALPIL